MNIPASKKIIEKVDNFVTESIGLYGEGMTSILASFVSDTLIGQVAPGIVTSALNYKQRQMENRVLILINQLSHRMDNIETALKRCKKEDIAILKNEYFPLLFDYAMNEVQEKKITYIVNGFESIIDKSIFDQDTILSYYDVLAALRISDIECLLMIPEQFTKTVLGVPNPTLDAYIKFQERYEGEEGQQRYMINKLRQLGLVLVKDKVMVSNAAYSLESLCLTTFGILVLNFFRLNSQSL